MSLVSDWTVNLVLYYEHMEHIGNICEERKKKRRRCPHRNRLMLSDQSETYHPLLPHGPIASILLLMLNPFSFHFFCTSVIAGIENLFAVQSFKLFSVQRKKIAQNNTKNMEPVDKKCRLK